MDGQLKFSNSMLISYVSLYLYILFIKSLESSILLEDWKSGHIAPIYKKIKVNNYRPVCLTSIVIKILESIIKDTLSNYLLTTCCHLINMALFLKDHVALIYFTP